MKIKYNKPSVKLSSEDAERVAKARQRINCLDDRLGHGEGASRERARLYRILSISGRIDWWLIFSCAIFGAALWVLLHCIGCAAAPQPACMVVSPSTGPIAAYDQYAAAVNRITP